MPDDNGSVLGGLATLASPTPAPPSPLPPKPPDFSSVPGHAAVQTMAQHVNTPAAPSSDADPDLEYHHTFAIDKPADHPIWQRIKDFSNMRSDDYDNKYAADDQRVTDAINNFLNKVIPFSTEASTLGKEVAKTKVGQQASQFVQQQLQHPEQFAMGGEFGGVEGPAGEFSDVLQGATKKFKDWFGKSKIVDETGKPLQVYHGTTSPTDFKTFATEGVPYDEKTGEPLVASSGDPNAYLGAHFAEDAKVANKFAENKEGWLRSRYEGEEPKPRVIPAYLKIENPKNFGAESNLNDFVMQGKISNDDLINQAMIADGLDPEEDPDNPEVEQWMQKYDNNPTFRAEQNEWIMRQPPSQFGYEDDSFLNEAAAELGEQAKQNLQASGYDGVRYKNEVEGGNALIAFDPEQIRHAIPAKQALNFDSIPGHVQIKPAKLPPQPRLPDEGQFAAIQTDDGGIYPDMQPEKQRTHIMLAKDLGIPAERIVSGGWLKDGVYEGSERSDAGRYGEQARAKQAVAQHRTAAQDRKQ